MKFIVVKDNCYYIVSNDGRVSEKVLLLSSFKDYIFEMSWLEYFKIDHDEDLKRFCDQISIICKSDLESEMYEIESKGLFYLSELETNQERRDKSKLKVGFFNNNSMRLLGDCVFDWIENIESCKAKSYSYVFSVHIGTMLGHINEFGDIVLSDNIVSGNDYDFAEAYGEHFCMDAHHKWGIIDDKLNVAVPCQYDFIEHTHNNMYKAYLNDKSFFLYKKDNEYNIVNYKEGELLFDDISEPFDKYTNKYDIYKTDVESGFEKEGLLDDGEIILQCEYATIDFPISFIIFASKLNDKYLVFDYKNRQIIADEVDSIFTLKEEELYAYVKTDIVTFIDSCAHILCQTKCSNFNSDIKANFDTYYAGRFVVELSNQQNNVGILDLFKTTMDKLDIYTDENWESIDSGFYSSFDGDIIYVNLKDGYEVCYNYSYEVLSKTKKQSCDLESNSNKNSECDDCSNDDFDDIYYHADDYENISDPLDAFDGDEEAYDEWLNYR